jgi:hypothetical protein
MPFQKGWWFRLISKLPEGYYRVPIVAWMVGREKFMGARSGAQVIQNFADPVFADGCLNAHNILQKQNDIFCIPALPNTFQIMYVGANIEEERGYEICGVFTNSELNPEIKEIWNPSDPEKSGD